MKKWWHFLSLVWKHIDGFIKYLGSKGALKKITQFINLKPLTCFRGLHMDNISLIRKILSWCSFRIFRQITLVMFLNFKSGPPEYLYGRWGKGYWCLRRWLRTRLLTFKRPLRHPRLAHDLGIVRNDLFFKLLTSSHRLAWISAGKGSAPLSKVSSTSIWQQL